MEGTSQETTESSSTYTVENPAFFTDEGSTKFNNEGRTVRFGRHRKTNKRVIIISVLAVVVVILIIAITLGLYFGLKDDESQDDSVSSRLEKEDLTKDPDFTVEIQVETLTWKDAMADTNTDTFKETAAQIEQSMDLFYKKSNVSTEYDYSVVTKLWNGSVWSTIRVHLQPSAQLHDGSALNFLSDNLREGQKRFLEEQAQLPSGERINVITFNTGSLKKVEATEQTTVPMRTTERSTISSTPRGALIDLAVRITMNVLPSDEWEESLGDKTSQHFITTAERIKNEVFVVFDQLFDTITLWELLSFQRDGNNIRSTAIMSAQTYTNYSIDLLFSVVSDLFHKEGTAVHSELVDMEWLEDLTPTVANQTLTVWYRNTWTPVCYSPDFQPIIPHVCRQLGYKDGRLYIGLNEKGALSLDCKQTENATTLSECVMGGINDDRCALVNTKCFNTKPKYSLSDGDGTNFGYVQVQWDNKVGLMCSSIVQSEEIAQSLCYDINPAFYGGRLLDSDSLPIQGPHGLWLVKASCSGREKEDPFLDCVREGWQFYNNITVTGADQGLRPPTTKAEKESEQSSLAEWPLPPSNSDPSSLKDCLIHLFCFDTPVVIHDGPTANIGVVRDASSPMTAFYRRDSFSDKEATVTCKSLGFQQGGVSLNFNPFPWLNRVGYTMSPNRYRCTGEEADITECSVEAIQNTRRSQPKDLAVAKCISNNPTEEELSVKLDADHSTVLVYHDGYWGTICANEMTQIPWTAAEAQVICRQLGFTNGLPRQPAYAQYSLPHVITRVHCAETSQKLSDCQHKKVGDLQDTSCNRRDAARVYCYNQAEEAKYELVTGSESNSGVVKVTYEGTDGYLCWAAPSGVFFPSYSVLCRTFGFQSGEQDLQPVVTDPNLASLWQADFYGLCSPRDANVDLCRSTTWLERSANITQNERAEICDYVYIYCYGKVRLSFGPRRSIGNIVIDDGTEIGGYGISYDGLTQFAADAACREINESPSFKAVVLPPGTYNKQMWLSKRKRFTCTSSSVSITQCMTDNYSYRPSQPALVLCYNQEKPPGLEPASATEWRRENFMVQVKAYDQWGTICFNDFSSKEAIVFCRSLDSNFTLAYTWKGEQVEDTPIWLHSITCAGDEQSLNQCSRSVIGGPLTTCIHSNGLVKVNCYRGESDVPKLFLADVEDRGHVTTGNVAATKNDQVAYMCVEKNPPLINQISRDVCKHLGFPLGGQLSRTRSSSYELTSLWTSDPPIFHCQSDNFSPQTCEFSWNFISGGDASQDGLKDEAPVKEQCPGSFIRPVCFTSKVRLSPPEGPEGILVIHNGVKWVALCATNFSTDLAAKFCKESGYSSGVFHPLTSRFSGYEVWFNEVVCATNTTRFEDCTFDDNPDSELRPCHNLVEITCLP